MSVFTRTVAVDTAGSAGAATGSSRLNVGPARLLAVKLDYDNAAPGTTDVTIVTDRAMDRTLFTRANAASDGLFHPRVLAHDNAAAEIAAGNNGYEPQLVFGYIEVRVAGCDAITAALTATLFFEG